ncbi:MAG: ABC transporter substrate-binding protein [Thermoleophilaceae bacterium]
MADVQRPAQARRRPRARARPRGAAPEVSEDGRTVTVRLREGVEFHDGEPFTADDVVFTYESILDPKVATSLRDLLDDTLAKVDAVDPATVRVTLKRVDPSFLDTLEFGIVPEHLLEGEDLNKTEFNTAKPVGTGPFKFDEFRKGDRVVMSANPDYFRGEPAIPRLVWAIVPDENVSTQAALLRAIADVQRETGLGVLLITHDLALARRECVIHIEQGAIAAPVTSAPDEAGPRRAAVGR